MKKNYFALSCALAAAATLSLSAQQMVPSGNSALYSLENAPELPKATPMSLPTQGNLPSVEAFGVTFMDYNVYPHSVKFNVNNLSKLERVSRLVEGDDNAFYRVMAGEWVNGKYYCEVVGAYTYVYHYVGWATLDPETGALEYIRDVRKENPHNYTAPFNYADLSNNVYFKEPTPFYQILDLAYNPADGKLYGLACNELSTSFESVVGTVNLQDGILTPIANVEDYSFAMTFDYDGNLYIAHNDGTYLENYITESKGTVICRYDLNKTFTEPGAQRPYLERQDNYGSLVMEDGNPLYGLLGFGSMTTDYTTGDIYLFLNGLKDNTLEKTADGQLVVPSGNLLRQSRVFVTNPREKKINYIGRFGYNDLVLGVTIPKTETAGDRKAPAQVVNLAAAHAADGASAVTLTWNNPETTWDLSDLTDLAEMKVAVDTRDNVVATLPASLDKESYEYEVKDLTTGMHTFYVYATNAAGAGVPMSVECWAGHDVPGMPAVVAETSDKKNVNISWTPAETGKNGGWYDKENVTYDIVRLPDNVTVAENVTGTSYTDPTTETIVYTYQVTPKTADGVGVTGVSNDVSVGGMVELPYDVSLDVESVAKTWTVFDQAGFTYDCYQPKWQVVTHMSWGLKLSPARYPADYYFATPKMKFEAGKTYYIEFTVYTQNQLDAGHPYAKRDFEITVGTDYTAEAMQKNVILDVDGQQNEFYYQRFVYGAWFTAETTDSYAAAFHLNSQSGDTDDIVAINCAKVLPCYDNDLQAMSISGTTALAKNKPGSLTVDVYNPGNLDASSFEVDILRKFGNFEKVIGTTKVDGTIKAHEHMDVKVDASPDIDGEASIYARVRYEGDENPDNDMTVDGKYVDIQTKEKDPADKVILGDLPGKETNTPIQFNYTYCGTQCIYLDNEINAAQYVKDGVNPKITGIAYRFTRVTENDGTVIQTEDCHVNLRVYMSLTTRKNFKRVDQGTTLEGLTKVYDGRVTIKGGDNDFMYIWLDEPFELVPGQNLMVTVVKDRADVQVEGSIFQFDMYNHDWNSGNFRAIRYASNTAKFPETGKFQEVSTGSNYCGRNPYVATLWFSIPTDETTDVVFINALTGEVDINNLNDAEVALYDLTGKVVFAGRVDGSVNQLPVANGLYILSVATAEGNTNLKVRINR